MREQGFEGAIVIYSNGIQADRLLQILASDPLKHTTASLNYSIATGDGAPQMPRQALARLEQYEVEHPAASPLAMLILSILVGASIPSLEKTPAPKKGLAVPTATPY
ncbi:MAG: hypothetical protein HC881_01840 [Leptolyngbyaceae cyanobacterium SL_7_1]|nr:hypothetical protein [Leptolyngbyaceae cyanobacterium SL_7_1]